MDGKVTGLIGVPWGWGRMTDRLPESPPPCSEVALDAATQTARYLDATGQVIEMGRHGTNKSKGTTTKSGGGDGNSPQVQRNDDNTVDYESD